MSGADFKLVLLGSEEVGKTSLMKRYIQDCLHPRPHQNIRRISLEQREEMLDFMLKHPSLATGKFTAPDGANHKQRLLSELAESLNSLPPGVTQSQDKWLKSWQDWISDVKSKAALLKKEMNKTGGGCVLSKANPLTPLEEKFLSFLGPCVVSGHTEVADPIFMEAPVPENLMDIEGGSEEILFDGPLPFLCAIPADEPVAAQRSGHEVESEIGSISTVASSSGSQKVKRRRRESSTCSVDYRVESLEVLKLSRKRLEMEEIMLNLKKEQIEIERKQAAVFSMCAKAFCAAMGAVETYYKRANAQK